MSINKTAYDTTLGKALSIDKTLHALKQSIVTTASVNGKINLISSTDFLPLEINSLNSSNSEVPLFGHPILIEDFKNRNYLAVDMRLVTKSDDDTLVVKNSTDYDFAYSRFVLNYSWINGDIGSIKNSLEFASIVYSQWLSEIITRRFALDPKDQMLLSVVTHLFYQSLFYETEELSENFKQLMATQAIRATKAPSEIVLEIVDKIQPMTDIDSYCENVKLVLENIRLKDFNKGILFTIVGMSWYGLNAKETIIIALEHIPTWVAICYSALSQRTYKNTTIYKIAEKYGKRGASDEFIASYANLVKSLENTANEAISDNEYMQAALNSLSIAALEAVEF